uniref:hypothetical protein n=1 Tax=Glycomyces xiaoerkulensis TaxID=2038139 RepID=UPI0038CC147B
MPPLVGAGTRFLLAGVLLGAFLTARGGLRRLKVDRAGLASCALLGLLLPVLGQGMVTVAEHGGAPSGLAALLIAGAPHSGCCTPHPSHWSPPTPTSIRWSRCSSGGWSWTRS